MTPKWLRCDASRLTGANCSIPPSPSTSAASSRPTGDGLLAEFSSVVDAVRCAAEVRAGMAERNAACDTPRVEFRIGINVGDIVMQDDDIFGDGVNIAARLESIDYWRPERIGNDRRYGRQACPE